MKKYIMKDNQDYRPGVEDTKPHGVILIRVEVDGVEWAYGEFSSIDEDMLDVTIEEEQVVASSAIL